MRKERVNRRFVVNYEPLREGFEDGIVAGVHGTFETEEEAVDAAASCDKWFNQPTVLEPAEDAESGRTVMVKRKQRLKKVRIWIEEFVNGELVNEGESCEEESGVKASRKSSKSTAEASPVS